MNKKEFLRAKSSLPPTSNRPNDTGLKQWSDSQITPMLRQISNKMISNLKYISFATFVFQLNHTVQDFHAQSRNEPYVILIAEDDAHKRDKGCSDDWVVSLAFEKTNLREPHAILTLDSINEDYLKDNPTIKHVLVLDDAAYSGDQKMRAMRDFFKQCVSVNELSVHMGLIYLSEIAKSNIQSINPNLLFLTHENMPSIGAALNKHETSYLKKLDNTFDFNLMLTYFDHRYADALSAYQPIYYGDNLFPAANIHQLVNVLGHSSQPALSDNEFDCLARSLRPAGPSSPGYTIPRITAPYKNQSALNCSDARTKDFVFVPTTLTEVQQKAVDALYSPSETDLCLPARNGFFGANLRALNRPPKDNSTAKKGPTYYTPPQKLSISSGLNN